MNRFIVLIISSVVLFNSVVVLAAEQKEVIIDVQKVRDNIYMLKGQGGNIGISSGKDGVFMIDDQFAPLSVKIKKAIQSISKSPVKFLINTHWHGDHTGGNDHFSHDGAIIVAHKNVRERMSSDQLIKFFKAPVKASPMNALPVITFNKEISFHINDETAQVIHMPHGHTDGDAIIWFKKSNVIHMGDLFFTGRFPFIDISSGGSINGLINAANWVLENANRDTKIIPGHGELSDMEGLLAYRNMLVETRTLVVASIEENEELEFVIDEKPLSSFAKKWGNGFIKQDAFVQFIFESVKAIN